MNKLDIFCFTSVARTKSFSLTAKELRISQQAVSKHIRNIEEELGYQLFFRNSGPVELTKAGIYMLEYFNKRDVILKQIASEFCGDTPSLSLQIGFSQWIGSPGWILDTARQYKAQHPDLKLHLLNLDSSELLQSVSSHKTDLVISSRYTTRYLSSTWKSVRIGQQPLYIITGSQYHYDMNHLEQYPLYAPEAGETNTETVRRRVLSTCRQLGFTPRTVNICHDMGTVVLNVLLNHGVTLGAYPPDERNRQTFSFTETLLSADIMLSYPYQSASFPVCDFVSRFIDIAESDRRISK